MNDEQAFRDAQEAVAALKRDNAAARQSRVNVDVERIRREQAEDAEVAATFRQLRTEIAELRKESSK